MSCRSDQRRQLGNLLYFNVRLDLLKLYYSTEENCSLWCIVQSLIQIKRKKGLLEVFTHNKILGQSLFNCRTSLFGQCCPSLESSEPSCLLTESVDSFLGKRVTMRPFEVFILFYPYLSLCSKNQTYKNTPTILIFSLPGVCGEDRIWSSLTEFV